MANNDKVFVGQTKNINTKFGEIIKISLGPSDFQKLQDAQNEKGWVNLEMKNKRDGGYYLQVSNFVPKAGAGVAANDDDDDNLPF